MFKQFRVKLVLATSLCAIWPAGSSALAQGWTGPPVLVQLPLVDVVQLNRFASLPHDGNVQDSAKNIPPKNVAFKASLTYQPSLERRKTNLANFVKKSRANDPLGAAEMARLFASTDIIGAIGQGIAPAGLKVNNVADAYSVYWTSAWNASIGSTETPSRAAMTAVKKQASSALIASPAFVSATDAQKQEFAEALLIQAALIDASVEQAAGNPAQVKAVAKAVRQGAKASGLDLDAFELTEAGFVPAR